MPLLYNILSIYLCDPEWKLLLVYNTLHILDHSSDSNFLYEFPFCCSWHLSLHSSFHFYLLFDATSAASFPRPGFQSLSQAMFWFYLVIRICFNTVNYFWCAFFDFWLLLITVVAFLVRFTLFTCRFLIDNCSIWSQLSIFATLMNINYYLVLWWQ